VGTEGCGECVQQDAISRYGHWDRLDDIGTCQMWVGAACTGTISTKRNRKVCCQTSLLLWGILNACTRIVALEEGRCVHEQISHSGCRSHVFVGNSSVDLYAKCGSLKDAGRLSNKMPSYDVVTWNAIILGHLKCGQGQEASELF
jgi:hypothetical protein